MNQTLGAGWISGRIGAFLIFAAGTAAAGAPSPAGPVAAGAPVSFRREVIAVLTREGCNSGTCHGTPAGKNGFRLSLRGYDPVSDHRILTLELGGRRVNRTEPEQSLILLKATAQVTHGGGRRLSKGSEPYRLLADWVAQGAGDDGPSSPALLDLQVLPPEETLARRPWSRPLTVLARFAGGEERDVTALARFSVNDEALASVTAGGIAVGRERGEAAVTAEYLTRAATSRLIFLEEPPAAGWRGPPATNYVDRHVFEKLRLLGIPASGEATEGEFLRRVHLDAIGVLPTPQETREFLADRSADKRARLVDRLLERPEYAQFWGMRYADRLGCNQRFVGQRGAYRYFAWLVNAMAVNVPEDRLAREVLTSSGGNYSHPAAGFYRRLRDPESAAETVSQLFLGVRLQCARCHNHPGDRWTQDDHLGLAAFFAGIKYKDGPFFNHLYDKEETVFLDRRAELVDRRTGAAVPPRFLGGAKAEIPAGADRREALASWLTGPGNPYFARVSVNRIWFHLFGRGIVEPVDDFKISNPPVNEPLLDALANDFVAHGFDRKHLIRVILNSRTYALGSRPNDGNAADEKYFSHARVRLLGAEQLLDAVSAATGASERFEGLPPGFRAAQVPDGEYQNRFLTAFGRPARAMACECERDGDSNLSQALHLVGGETIQKKMRAEEGRVARLAASALKPGEILDELFLASLCRLPSPEEREALAPEIERPADRRRAIEDVLWALLNHPEFLYQH